MILNLLTAVSAQDGGTVATDGRFWRLTQHDLAADAPPEFICISYTWGLGRGPSPFHAQVAISDRTMPAVKAVARLRPASQHIWVDALCVPRESPERERTLESSGRRLRAPATLQVLWGWIQLLEVTRLTDLGNPVGHIYAMASEVIAVLSRPVLPALRRMRAHKPLTDSLLSALEQDEWVTRAWTYQETVNARRLLVTCDGAGEVAVSGQELVNHVGQALSKLTTPHLQRRAQHPGLDALEDLVDYLTAGAHGRSALQVMAKMDRRTSQRPEDHFYAMIGAISWTHASSVAADEASEAFMQICENKGDFSFLFSAAPRETTARRRWRPAPGALPAVLQWDVTGSGQAGRVTPDGLQLQQVVKLRIGGPCAAPIRKFIGDWLTHIRALPPGAVDDVEKLVPAALAALRRMGFVGPGRYFTTPAGVFFPCHLVLSGQPDCIIASSSLMWPFGSPGLLRCKEGKESLFSAGVLVGNTDGLPVTTETL